MRKNTYYAVAYAVRGFASIYNILDDIRNGHVLCLYKNRENAAARARSMRSDDDTSKIVEVQVNENGTLTFYDSWLEKQHTIMASDVKKIFWLT